MLNLYILPNCPFCKKVLAFLQENKIPFNALDISENKDFLDDLIKIGGEKQVPFLVDTENNVRMYESDDIIDYAKRLTLKN